MPTSSHPAPEPPQRPIPHHSAGFFRRLNPFLHPVLFAIFPLLSLFEQNQTELPLGVLWSPLAISVASGAALFGVFLLIFRRATKAGALASLVVVAFFYYGVFHDHVSGWGLIAGCLVPLWIALFAIGFVALARTRRDLRNFTVIATVGAAILVLGPLATIVIYQLDHPAVRATDPRLWPTALKPPVSAPRAPRPDIYVLIPDDYARADILKQYFHYDNTPFIRQLKRRGFIVSGQARSPYSDSESNIAAALNMGYLNGLPKILGKSSQDVRPVKTLIEDSRASRLLGGLGYRYVHLDSDEVTFAAGNPGISPVATPDSFTSLWLRDSVLRAFGGDIGFNDAAAAQRFRKSINSAFSKLGSVPQQPSPKFVVFHTLAPHDPYIFGAKGQPVTFPSTSEDALGSKLGMRYYLKQLQFVSRKLLDAVDSILAHSKASPIIIIQADEGFQANSETVGEAAMQDIRVKGLAAFYFPGISRARVPQPPNTVNTLRFVFNHYFGTHYHPLSSASYPEQDLPYQFEKMKVK